MDYLAGLRYDGTGDRRRYPHSIPAIGCLSRGQLEFFAPVTFFVGENGTGKSTLLEAIAVACGFNPEGGSRDFFFSTRDTHSGLGEHLTVVKRRTPKDGFFLRAESFYNTASFLEDNSTLARYGGVSLHAQSHGESFLALVEHRFAGNGLYLLDEPEAALSPQRLMSLLVLIDRLVSRIPSWSLRPIRRSSWRIRGRRSGSLARTASGRSPTGRQSTISSPGSFSSSRSGCCACCCRRRMHKRALLRETVAFGAVPCYGRGRRRAASAVRNGMDRGTMR